METKSLEERIEKGSEAIAQAKTRGEDVREWQEHLNKLISQRTSKNKSKFLMRVKMGKFGFCTCLISSSLCTGCWKVRTGCNCIELDIDPKEELTAQYYKSLMKK